jgi:hypothetical protein
MEERLQNMAGLKLADINAGRMPALIFAALICPGAWP